MLQLNFSAKFYRGFASFSKHHVHMCIHVWHWKLKFYYCGQSIHLRVALLYMYSSDFNEFNLAEFKTTRERDKIIKRLIVGEILWDLWEIIGFLRFSSSLSTQEY